MVENEGLLGRRRGGGGRQRRRSPNVTAAFRQRHHHRRRTRPAAHRLMIAIRFEQQWQRWNSFFLKKKKEEEEMYKLIIIKRCASNGRWCALSCSWVMMRVTLLHCSTSCSSSALSFIIVITHTHTHTHTHTTWHSSCCNVCQLDNKVSAISATRKGAKVPLIPFWILQKSNGPVTRRLEPIDKPTTQTVKIKYKKKGEQKSNQHWRLHDDRGRDKVWKTQLEAFIISFLSASARSSYTPRLAPLSTT